MGYGACGFAHRPRSPRPEEPKKVDSECCGPPYHLAPTVSTDYCYISLSRLRSQSQQPLAYIAVSVTQYTTNTYVLIRSTYPCTQHISMPNNCPSSQPTRTSCCYLGRSPSRSRSRRATQDNAHVGTQIGTRVRQNLSHLARVYCMGCRCGAAFAALRLLVGDLHDPCSIIIALR